MSYDVEGAIGAGIFAGIVVALLLYITLAFFPRVKLNLFHILGTLLPVDQVLLIYLLGAIAFLGLSTLFALVHTAFLEVLGIETGIFAWGAIFGLVNWLVVGLAIGPFSRVHPWVRAGRMGSLGVYVLNDRTLTAMTFLAGNVLYGMFVGSFYDALR